MTDWQFVVAVVSGLGAVIATVVAWLDKRDNSRYQKGVEANSEELRRLKEENAKLEARLDDLEDRIDRAVIKMAEASILAVQENAEMTQKAIAEALAAMKH